MNDNLSIRPLMFAQMKAEMELAHQPVQTLLNALRGIASCATQCACCQMQREIAAEALAKYASSR